MQRQETEGPWCKFPKAWYEDLLTLDLRELSEDDLGMLDHLWDTISDEQFLPFPQIAIDPVRRQIDDVFSKILRIQSLDEFREILSKEPLIKGEAIGS